MIMTMNLMMIIMLITQLVVDYVFDARLRSLLDDYDFYVMPCVNPDGYEFSHNTVCWHFADYLLS